jgi:hypothetical protein
MNRSDGRNEQVSTATLEREVRPATTAVAPLALTDRCDAPAVVGLPNGRKGRGACGAQAFVRAVLPNGHDLVLCAHHGREHEAALAAAGATIRDDSGVLDA